MELVKRPAGRTINAGAHKSSRRLTSAVAVTDESVKCAKIQHRTLQQTFTLQAVQLNAQTNTHTQKYEETNSTRKRRILQPERRLTHR